MKIATIIGTRPEIIKMSRMMPLLDKAFKHTFLFTNQHYSEEMCSRLFEELNIRKPDTFLNIQDSSLAVLGKAIYRALKDFRDKPDYVLVYGDTNSTLAAALAAKKAGIKLIHVEAGLRSFDERMPEEKNRVQIDRLSDILFTPTELTRNFLMKEGIKKNVYIVGNTIVDVCKYYIKRARKSKILQNFKLIKDKYFLITCHRQENVDAPERLAKILNSLELVNRKGVFPMHPRTEKRFKQFNLEIPDNIIVSVSIGYLDFLNLLANAAFVITDSGGVQEEAITLKTPCITIRESTERWETVFAGVNFLSGIEPRLVNYYAKMVLDTDLKQKIKGARNPYGTGSTSRDIVNILKKL